MNYFQRKSWATSPGGILTVIGLLFVFEILTEWHYSSYTWPVTYCAFGLLQLYLYIIKTRTLNSHYDSCFISLFLCSTFISSSLLLAICLIIIGLIFSFQR